MAKNDGVSLESVLVEFEKALGQAKFVVGQNLKFDLNIMGAEMIRKGFSSRMLDMPVLDTCTEVTAQMCQIPGGRGGKWKLPTLTELHEYLFPIPFSEIGNNSCLDVEGGELCNTSDVKSHHDHSDCSDLHCSGFSFPVPDSVFNAESASSALVKSKVNFYISATLSSPYMPPITSL